MIRLIEKNLTKSVLHRVQEGESIDSICMKYNTTRHRLMLDNPYFTSLYVGCLLYIGNCNKKVYIVKPTDTIKSIAKKLDFSEDKLIKLVGPQVFIGQIIEYEVQDVN